MGIKSTVVVTFGFGVMFLNLPILGRTEILWGFTGGDFRQVLGTNLALFVAGNDGLVTKFKLFIGFPLLVSVHKHPDHVVLRLKNHNFL